MTSDATTVGGRYELGELLGRGGIGSRFGNKPLQRGLDIRAGQATLEAASIAACSAFPGSRSHPFEHSRSSIPMPTE